MIAQWVTGAFPFGTRDALREGTPPAGLEPRLADLLSRALAAKPQRRTTLTGLVDELRRYAR